MLDSFVKQVNRTTVVFVPRRSAAARVAGALLTSQAWLPLAFSLGLAPLAQPAVAAQTPSKPQTILLVSYAVTKAAYDKIIPQFVADWKKKTGQTVVIKSSYGGSGSQTRAVIDGWKPMWSPWP